MNIHLYAADGNLPLLQQELDRGVSVDALDEKGHTSLLVAASSPLASLNTLQLLVNHGADVQFRDANGYSILLKAIYRSFAEPRGTKLPLIKFLIESGAPFDAVSSYGETPVQVASIHGDFALVKLLLDRGANPEPLGWSELHSAVVFGSEAEVASLLDAGAKQEQQDAWERSPLLLAVHAGRLDVARLLVARGCDLTARGRFGKTALLLAISQNDADLLRWLIAAGCDIEEADDFEGFPLLEAAQNDAVACVQVLLEAGANSARKGENNDGAIGSATSPEVIELLVRAGEELSDVPLSGRLRLLGIPQATEIEASPAEYRAHRDRTFGKTNPERMNNPFWEAMVRTRESAYTGAVKFESRNFDKGPVWCFQRFGQSLTRLPDGRYVEIGGEHEDHYDPDFCIYNDVVVHHGDGTFDIMGYPESDFPTTDFHSATLVPPYIYIIGNLGYPHQRRPGETPVYRLHCETWRIKKVETTGEMPGWIHGHKSTHLGDSRIRIRGGKVVDGSEHALIDNSQSFILDLANFTWRIEMP